MSFPSLTHRLGEERGMAVPVAMFVLTLLVLVGGFALREAVQTSDASTEDRRAKRALQAADAGIDAAIYRMNIFDLINEPTDKCVQTNGAGGLVRTGYVQVSGENWCPRVTENLGDGTSYSYYVAPESEPVLAAGTQTVGRTVVSTGCASLAGTNPSPENCAGAAGSETRRVAANTTAPLPTPLFGGFAAISSLQEVFMGGNSAVTGSIRSNQGIRLESNAAVKCMNDGLTPALGDATSGPGYTVALQSNASVCGARTSAPAPFTLPPVNADVANTNDNARICVEDPCTDSGSIIKPTAANGRRLVLDSNSTLTLGGNIYSFCQLHIKSNSQLIIAPRDPGTAVRIYIDKPADCPGVQLPSVWLPGNSILKNLNTDPSTLQIYVEGSGGVEITSNPNVAATIYAPESNFTFDSGTAGLLTGAVAARKVTLLNNAKVVYDRRASDISTDGVFPLMRRQAYRECLNTAAPATPGSGCAQVP